MTVRLSRLDERHARAHRPDEHRSRPCRSASGSRSARGTSRQRSTAWRICWSTWPSRARRGARRCDIAAEIEAVGGHVNAYTSREHTAYYAKVLKENVPLAIDILADILQHSTFDARELERERGGDPAGDRPGQRHARRHHLRPLPGARLPRPADGPAGAGPRRHHPPHGPRDGGGLSPAQPLRAAACCWSRPAISSTARSSIWRSAPSADLPAESTTSTEPARYVGGDLRQSRDLEQAHILLGLPRLRLRRARLLCGLGGLGGAWAAACPRASSRRSARSAASSIRSIPSPTPIAMAASSASMPAPAQDEAAELMPALCAEINRLGRGLAPDELERARAQLKAGLLMSLEGTTRALRAAGDAHAGVTAARSSRATRRPHRRGRRRRRWRGWRSASARRRRPSTALGPIERLETYERLADATCKLRSRCRSSFRVFASLGAVPPAFRLAGRRTLLRAPERRDWQGWARARAVPRATSSRRGSRAGRPTR